MRKHIKRLIAFFAVLALTVGLMGILYIFFAFCIKYCI